MTVHLWGCCPNAPSFCLALGSSPPSTYSRCGGGSALHRAVSGCHLCALSPHTQPMSWSTVASRTRVPPSSHPLSVLFWILGPLQRTGSRILLSLAFCSQRPGLSPPNDHVAPTLRPSYFGMPVVTVILNISASQRSVRWWVLTGSYW